MTERIKNKKAGIDSQRRLWEFVFVAILVLYPLRHIAWGLDLWDTGYGYANFEYMGTQHMDPMWLFSTYLTTAIGHFFSLLPGAGTLIGMNFYTGLSGGAWVLFLHESTEDPGTSGIPGRIYGGELLLVPHGLFLQLCDLRVLSGIGGLSVSWPCPGEKGVAVCRRSSAGL